MRRKVIQLAGKTLVVSLPSKWAKKCGVKKGDEVEIEEGERQLIIASSLKKEKTVGAWDLKNLHYMLHRVMSTIYKAGYDEFEITYDSPGQYTTIMNVINTSSVGYEVIRQSKRTLLVRNLSDLHAEEFDNILRRLFLTLLSSADDSLEYVKQGNLTGMEEVVLRDMMINKYGDLCRRMLNIKGQDTIRKTTTYYYLCEAMEKVGDGYKDLMKFMIKNKITKANKSTLELLSDLNHLLRMIYELFYDFNLNKVETFGELSDKIKKRFDTEFETNSIKDLRLHYYVRGIFSMIFDMNGALITGHI